MVAIKKSETIKVVVRVRPLNSREKQEERKIIAVASEDQGVIDVKNPDSGEWEHPKSFAFDSVFSDKCLQKTIYDVCAAPVVQSVLEGYNGTIFAYGQTGTGKTHTMEGVYDDPDLQGIIPRAFQQIFDYVTLTSNEKYLVRTSYFEIYNEEIRDLLNSSNKTNLELKESSESGVYVKDLTCLVVKSVTEINQVLTSGKKNRSVGATLMNQASSRSHSVFTIIVECCSSDAKGREHIRVGKLNLVDLAGSERQTKTGATGNRLKEATKINLSLSALGNVISALVDGKSHHIPYKDSKLTRILQDSLGGNTKTVMCANAGPADYNYDETLSTLRYANRAKNIKNKPKVNEDPKDAVLREYQEEITKLKQELSEMSTKDKSSDTSNNEVQDYAVLQEIQKQAEKEKAEIEQKSKLQMEDLRKQQYKTTQERNVLQEKIELESKARTEIENQRISLHQKLQEMEAKLIIGGEIANKASKQEVKI